MGVSAGTRLSRKPPTSRRCALKLVIQAKLEAVEAGITTFEDEFLAHLVLPSGETFGEWAAPQLERAYITGAMPSSLLGLPAPRIVEDGS